MLDFDKVVAVATLMLWAYLLYLLLESMFNGMAAGSGKGDGRHVQQRSLAQRMAALQDLRKNNPALFKVLQRRAGLGHFPLSNTSDSRKLVEALARRVNLEQLQIAEMAHQQTDLDFDLEANIKRDEVNHPTPDMEPMQMRSMDQLSQLLPHQWLLGDDEFYRLFGNQELQILQPHSTKVEKKTLHILLDVSGSMGYEMSSGVPRHNWARAIALSLLLKAIKSEAQYQGRPFDSSSHELWKAASEAEAQKVIDLTLDRGTGEGGTAIYPALVQAVKDVTPQVEQYGSADILLITDGEDSGVPSSADLKKMLGPNVRLHVASIGHESANLKGAATTYKVFN